MYLQAYQTTPGIWGTGNGQTNVIAGGESEFSTFDMRNPVTHGATAIVVRPFLECMTQRGARV
jgi:hypothetical protein